jgi:hypothetical protein
LVAAVASTSYDVAVFSGVVLMKQNRYVGAFRQTAHHPVKFIQPSIVEVDEVGLYHYRRVLKDGGLDDRSDHFQVADIERRDSETVFENVLKK